MSQQHPGTTAASDYLFIVVGAHLDAERHDRPTAAWLRDELEPLARPAGCTPLVLTDIWYLNNDELRRRPAISLGAPGVNALTAHWASKLPSAFAVDGRYMVQLDLEGLEPIGACWGVSPAETRLAAEVFMKKFAHEFMETAARS